MFYSLHCDDDDDDDDDDGDEEEEEAEESRWNYSATLKMDQSNKTGMNV